MKKVILWGLLVANVVGLVCASDIAHARGRGAKVVTCLDFAIVNDGKGETLAVCRDGAQPKVYTEFTVVEMGTPSTDADHGGVVKVLLAWSGR